MEKSELSYKNRRFSLVGNYLRPSNNYKQSSFNINAVVLILIICKDLRNWSNVYLNLSFLLSFWKIETLFHKLKDQKLQTMQL